MKSSNSIYLKVCFFVLFFSISVNVFCQDLKRQKELGIAFSSMDNFGLTYRVGKGKGMWRFNGFMINTDSDMESNDKYNEVYTRESYLIGFGREFRRTFAERLTAKIGFDYTIGMNYSDGSNDDISSIYNRYSYTEETVLQVVSFVFGLNYSINEWIDFGFEVLPGVGAEYGSGSRSYGDQQSVEYEISRQPMRFSTTNASLTLIFKWR